MLDATDLAMMQGVAEATVMADLGTVLRGTPIRLADGGLETTWAAIGTVPCSVTLPRWPPPQQP